MDDWQKEVNRKFPRHDLELPIGVTGWRFERIHQSQPSSELEAMMMAAPFEEPEVPADNGWLDPYETIFLQNGIDIELTDQQRQVLDARIMSRLTFRAIGDLLDMPPSTVHRIYQETIEEIRSQL